MGGGTMPVTYSITGKLVRIRLAGAYTPEDVTRCFLEALADEDFPPVAAVLMDTTESTSLAGRDAGQIRYVAQFAGRHGDRINHRCAVLVASDLGYGLTKLGAIYSEGVGITAEIFRNEAAALEWLGITPEDNSL